MPHWIVGLQKAAIEHRPGVSSADWAQAEAEAGGAAPIELRELYSRMNGATFASGVVLFPLRGTGEVKGMAEQSLGGAGGFPAREAWRFGRRDEEHLAAVRKRRLGEVEDISSASGPTWLDPLAEDAWVFAVRDEARGRVRLYKSLEHLLSVRIPPASAEEFGERTYAQAMSLVEEAMAQLSEAPKAPGKKPGQKASRKPAPAAGKKPGAKASRKPAPAPGKKPAQKARTKLAPAPGKKPGAKASSKRAPAPRKKPAQKASARPSPKKRAPARKKKPSRR